MPREQTLRQPTPGLSGTRWSEDLSHEPSQHNEPPIPSPSPSSKPPEDVPTHEPEPEVPPTQSTEEPFAHPATPRSFPPTAPKNPTSSSPLVPSSPHSHNDACQEFTNLRPTLMIPQAIVHESINQILSEHFCLLHMIPFVDAS
ncbi:hypothetical protein O181_068149 [Austropuccinia psidii MF-1]|uniref:Uncharacterized protein n=1 Tax=Austropuccinia psidii MF-1 TaxID=1389203 RepID=A0A9Q3EWC5_9BASI|nr:hypothetical protein [Austropuccinia psidii MF-1]